MTGARTGSRNITAANWLMMIVLAGEAIPYARSSEDWAEQYARFISNRLLIGLVDAKQLAELLNEAYASYNELATEGEQPVDDWRLFCANYVHERLTSQG